MKTATVVQEQAYNMRDAMRTNSSTLRNKQGGQAIVSMKITEGTWNLIDRLLQRIEEGELVECPKQAPAVDYKQPGLLADEAGGALFSMS